MTYSVSPLGTEAHKRITSVRTQLCHLLDELMMKEIKVCHWRTPCEEWKCSETHTGKGKTYIYRGLIAQCFENMLLQRFTINVLFGICVINAFLQSQLQIFGVFI